MLFLQLHSVCMGAPCNRMQNEGIRNILSSTLFPVFPGCISAGYSGILKNLAYVIDLFPNTCECKHIRKRTNLLCSVSVGVSFAEILCKTCKINLCYNLII